MAKRKNSRKKNREQIEMEQNRQQTIIMGVVAIVMLTIVFVGAIILNNNRELEPTVDNAGNNERVVDPERPLTALLPAERDGYYETAPPMVIDTNKSYEAILRTEKGDIHITLFDDEAPLTVNNFVYLANQGFYDGITFHRVISNFMAQGGDPTSSGTGGPGYDFADETDNGLAFDRSGLLAMANRGPNTNGSQFFITYTQTPHLNGLHTIFGEVTDGFPVLQELTRIQPPQQGGDVIQRIDIVEN